MKQEVRNGILGGFSLLFFYFLVMTIASRSWSDTISQFKELWYWMIILSSGFGIQIGLFTHLRDIIKYKQMTNSSKAVAVTSTGASAVSMVACCAHHLTEVLPIIGLSGLAVFLTQYQIPLIILGVIMNGFGVYYMVKQIYKVKGRHFTLGFFPSISNINKVLLVAFFAVLAIVIYTVSQNQPVTSVKTTNTLSPQVNEEANVSVEVTPKVLKIGKNPQFQIVFNTHSLDLSFDVAKIVVLTDDKGNNYFNTNWNGSGPGGHHRDGSLSFNTPLKETKYIELIIKDVVGVSERRFRWNI